MEGRTEDAQTWTRDLQHYTRIMQRVLQPLTRRIWGLHRSASCGRAMRRRPSPRLTGVASDETEGVKGAQRMPKLRHGTRNIAPPWFSISCFMESFFKRCESVVSFFIIATVYLVVGCRLVASFLRMCRTCFGLHCIHCESRDEVDCVYCDYNFYILWYIINILVNILVNKLCVHSIYTVVLALPWYCTYTIYYI